MKEYSKLPAIATTTALLVGFASLFLSPDWRTGATLATILFTGGLVICCLSLLILEATTAIIDEFYEEE